MTDPATPPSDNTGQPFSPGTGGSPGPAPPPDTAGAPRPAGLAVLALVFAVVSLLVPVLPGIVALVLAAAATRRARALPQVRWVAAASLAWLPADQP
jgi:hypothetical protein